MRVTLKVPLPLWLRSRLWLPVGLISTGDVGYFENPVTVTITVTVTVAVTVTITVTDIVIFVALP